MTFFTNLRNEEVKTADGNIVIKTPVENLAWAATPVSWSSSTTTSSVDVSESSSITKGDIWRTGRKGFDYHQNITTTNSQRTVATSETTTSTTTLSTSSNTVSSVIPFMRAKRILFSASGLKPNSKLIATFAGEEVNQYCVQTSSTRKPGILIAEPNGKIEGYFDLPNNKFKTGERKFKLADATDETISSAEALYTASGERLDTTITNKYDTVITTQKTVVDTTLIQETTVTNHWRDPVAQSFFVDTVESVDGAFIHSIDLFFHTADIEHEVLVQIRRMKDGYPTMDLIYPYAYAKLDGDKIKSSVNGSVATRFILQSPVFLPSGTEYAFVVMSNSEKASIWCSELGKKSYKSTDTIAPTGEIIAKQPYLGTMFISQNNSTWDAVQLRDVKFTINRCKFTKNKASVTYINSSEDDKFNNPNCKFMAPNALEFTEGSNEIKLYAHGHAMSEGDTFKLHFLEKGLTMMFGIPKADIENVPLVVSGTTATQIKFKTLKSALGSGSSGGDSMWMEGWVFGYSYAQLVKNDIVLNNTDINYKLSGKLQKNYSSAPYGNKSVIENEITELSDIFVVKSDNDRGVLINSEIITNNDFVSPIVYTDSMGIEGHLNIINNIDYANASNVVQEDSSPAKYIQKEVNLINPANELRIFFESIMPYGANISVYYKTGTGKIADDAKWLRLAPENGELINSEDNNDWRTQKYIKSFSDEWDVFQIMIVLQSSSRLIIPKIKNYRAIALNA